MKDVKRCVDDGIYLSLGEIAEGDGYGDGRDCGDHHWVAGGAGDGWGGAVWDTRDGEGQCDGWGHDWGGNGNGHGHMPEPNIGLLALSIPFPMTNCEVRRTDRILRCAGCIGGFECPIHGRRL